ncbi:MAG: hypothetical protein AB8G99_05855, partial [Planctomycetaceae bacterium]
LISPGTDGLYGTGGNYTDGESFDPARAAESDNVTNFCDGLTLAEFPDDSSWFLTAVFAAAVCLAVGVAVLRLRRRSKDTTAAK